PLDELHRPTVAEAVPVESDARLVGEVGRLDDERVAFPAPPCGASILPDVRAHMRTAVQWDDSRIVNHLVADHDFVRRLQNPVAVPVDHRHDRANDPAGDAAVVQREALRIVERAFTEGSLVSRRPSFLGFRRDGWNLAVRGLDDERRLPERLVEPGAVTAERADGVLGRAARKVVPLY